ncbi:MAG: tyrosine-type recombinase/integrase [Lachnospiraceae bacterium]|nr:tyrosine-type recombinase/integrase [Lachnospiraceae bacterium]
MGTTEPIRDLDELERLKNYYLKEHPNMRNYALIHTGLNTALRISDILALRWKDVYNFERKQIQKYIIINEKKTGKRTCIAINQNLRHTIAIYMEEIEDPKPMDYLFEGRTPGTALCRSQAFRIIKRACADLSISCQVSCHSLRKTFGYQAYNAGVNPTMLMMIFNHSSFAVTKRYLGIDQDDKDQVFLSLNL